MIVEKIQIRPRRELFRLENSDILGWDLSSPFIFPLLAGPAPDGYGFRVLDFAVISNCADDYGNIDAGALMTLNDGFQTCAIFRESNGSLSNIFAPNSINANPVVTFSIPGFKPSTGTTTSIICEDGWNSYADIADISAQAIYLFFNNGGAGALTGGDAANTVDFIIDYDLTKVGA